MNIGFNGVDNVSPGDTIIVKDGTYYEHVVVNKQLTLNQRMVLQTVL